MKIIITSDNHYLGDKLKDDTGLFKRIVDEGDGRQLNYVTELNDAFIAQVIKEKPDALILTGDLTFNGEKESHLELANKLLAVKESGITVFVIPGNHDINNPYAKGYSGESSYNVDAVTSEEFKEIYANFGYNDALALSDSSLSYTADLGENIRLYMLDTNMYGEENWSSGGMMGETLLNWTEEQLKEGENNGKMPIVMSHHNLIDHSSRLSFGYTILDGSKAISLYSKYLVKINFSGHIHMQNIVEKNDIYDIASGSLLVSPVQYGVVTVDDSGAMSYKTDLVDVEKWAKSNNITDENLLNFNQYSKDFFKNSSANKFKTKLIEDENIKQEDIDDIASLVGELNSAYFAGEVAGRKAEIMESNEYKVWLSYGENAPYKSYVESMLEEENDHTKLELQLLENKDKV